MQDLSSTHISNPINSAPDLPYLLLTFCMAMSPSRQTNSSSARNTMYFLETKGSLPYSQTINSNITLPCTPMSSYHLILYISLSKLCMNFPYLLCTPHDHITLTVFDNNGKTIPGLNLVSALLRTCMEEWLQFPSYRHQIEASGQLHAPPAPPPSHPPLVPIGYETRWAPEKITFLHW
jgi:hypothetical protein